MTKEELEAYDAMMVDRDRWRHRTERAENAVREALAQLEDIRTVDLAELRLGSVATAVSKARVALRLAKMKPLPEHLRGSELRSRVPSAIPSENAESIHPESKPADAEQPTDKGLDGTPCSRNLRGRLRDVIQKFRDEAEYLLLDKSSRALGGAIAYGDMADELAKLAAMPDELAKLAAMPDVKLEDLRHE